MELARLSSWLISRSKGNLLLSGSSTLITVGLRYVPCPVKQFVRLSSRRVYAFGEVPCQRLITIIIPAPIANIEVVAVEKLVADRSGFSNVSSRGPMVDVLAQGECYTSKGRQCPWEACASGCCLLAFCFSRGTLCPCYVYTRQQN